MSIASEIQRLQTAKSCIKAAIESKGVTVGSNIKLDDYNDCINAISSGGGYVVEALVVGGGGSQQGNFGGAGGGGVVKSMLPISCKTATVTVGAAGNPASSTVSLRNGCASMLKSGNSCIRAEGGFGPSTSDYHTGGCSGMSCVVIDGTRVLCNPRHAGGTGWQGTYAYCNTGGGGGGASGDGGSSTRECCTCGIGGSGCYGYGGGGGGGSDCVPGGQGSCGQDGGGNGRNRCRQSSSCNASNYGGGAGGADRRCTCGCQGVVDICYTIGLYTATGGNCCYTCDGYCVHRFTSDGTFTIVS